MIELGKRIELFVDEYLIAERNNVSFRLNPPQDEGKVIGFDEPWEGEGSLGLTIFDDGENIKCYYRGFPTGALDTDPRQTACLAVSDDGLHFERYPVNEIEYDGVKENNIIKMDEFCHNFAPFYDKNPNCKPDERYKAIGGESPVKGIHVFGSPDGIHWHLLHDKGVITKGIFDSMNMAFYSPSTGLYHCYSRYWYDPDKDYEIDDKEYKGIRSIQNCTSEDFIHWERPKENRYAEGHPTDELYTNAATTVPGAEHIMVSIPMRFHRSRKKSESIDEVGISDAVLMTSRDGVYWDRMVKDAWLAGGLIEHEWSQRNFITSGGIICRNDKFYFYVEKNYMWDDDGLWAYSVPKYRLMSAYADGNGGTVTTKQLKFVSDDIFINYKTSAYGYVKLSFVDEQDNVIAETEELYGNELSEKIHVDGLVGKKGKIKIELCEAHIYAIGCDMM
ncbi:MAG: hypothetical protein E7481_08630 [Ruminococcaceae bacterium]|nr:hypothetical protein [Oscillospiraceae bacterium]